MTLPLQAILPPPIKYSSTITTYVYTMTTKYRTASQSEVDIGSLEVGSVCAQLKEHFVATCDDVLDPVQSKSRMMRD